MKFCKTFGTLLRHSIQLTNYTWLCYQHVTVTIQKRLKTQVPPQCSTIYFISKMVSMAIILDQHFDLSEKLTISKRAWDFSVELLLWLENPIFLWKLFFTTHMPNKATLNDNENSLKVSSKSVQSFPIEFADKQTRVKNRTFFWQSYYSLCFIFT